MSPIRTLFSRNGKNAADALRDRRRAALLEWRGLVERHEAGEALDLADVERTAVALGIRDPASAFGQDCDAAAALAAAEEELRREESRYAASVAASVAASAKLFDLRRQLQEAEFAIAAAPHAAISASAIRARRTRIMASAPRLYSERVAAEAAPIGAGPVEDPLALLDQAEAVPLGHGVAEFVDDSDD